MNKVWVFIIFVSLIFGLIYGNTDKMINNLFIVPENVLKNLMKIGSMLVIYNGLFKIALKAEVIDKISIIFLRIINKIFKNLNEECKKMISTSIVCNLLGLGPANMTIAIKVVNQINTLPKANYNLSMYLLINISSLCFMPLSLLTLRSTFFAKINIPFVFILFIASLVTTDNDNISLGKYTFFIILPFSTIVNEVLEIAAEKKFQGINPQHKNTV